MLPFEPARIGANARADLDLVLRRLGLRALENVNKVQRGVGTANRSM